MELFVGGVFVVQVMVGQEVIIVLDSMLFYVEFGGQIGDVGFINLADVLFEVIDIGKEC